LTRSTSWQRVTPWRRLRQYVSGKSPL
jgi:hypothetical protein